MSNSFLNEIKNTFNKGSTLVRLIMVNLIVWLGVKLVLLSLYLLNVKTGIGEAFIKWLAVPAALGDLLFKPWTLITYMFLHEDFFHILFNMLWLYWFGKIFLEYMGNKKLLSTYILGGLSGAVLFILAFNVFPVFQSAVPLSYALGASASVLAIVIAVATYVPNYKLQLIFIGPVKIKYIAIVSVLLDIMNIQGSNSGGHIAHLGGAIFGFYYVRQLNKGRDLSRGFMSILDKITSYFYTSGHKLHVSHANKGKSGRGVSDEEYNSDKKAQQDKMDIILDKISKSGYDSLSKEEKDILFRISNKK